MQNTLTRLPPSTKFAPPRIGAKYVQRKTLLAQLERGQRCCLTLVTGSAGYGKTTLLAQWRQACMAGGAKVAWLSLTRDETSFAEFCVAFFAALQRLDIPVDADLLADGSSPAAMDSVIAAVVDAAAELPNEVFVMLDDYQHVTAPRAHKLVQKLLDHCPANLHLVIASRVAPPLALSRLRMMDQIVEIDSSELPFGPAETRTFLEQSLGADKLNADEQGLIQEITGGWPSCLQLIVMMLKNRPEARSRLRDLVWQSDDLQAYLSEEVMANLPAELVAFAESLSIFRRFSAGLAEAVTGNAESADWLRRMEVENLLIHRVESEDRMPWYRFHRLFGEFLTTRLARRGKAQIDELHRRGSRWFADNRLLADAVRHASMGGDLEFAADVIRSTAPATWTLEYLGPTLHLLERLPEETLFRHQRVFVMACLTVAFTARYRRAMKWVAQLEAGSAAPDPEVRAVLPLVHATIAYQRDDTPRIIASLEGHDEPVGDNAFVQYAKLAVLATAYAADGRYADVRRLLDQHPIPVHDRDNDMALVVGSTRVLALLLAGDIREAERLGTPMLTRASRVYGHHSLCANLCAGLLGDAYYELDRIDDARETIANRLGLLHTSAPEVMVHASLCRSRLDLLQEGPDAALAFLQAQTAHLRSLGQSRVVAHMLGEQVRVHLQRGETDLAAELCDTLDEMASAHGASHGFMAELPAIAAAARGRVLLASAVGDKREENAEQALAALEPVRTYATSFHRGRLGVLVDLLDAQVLDTLGRDAEAAACVKRALESGARLGLCRTFLDEGRAVARLLPALLREWKGDDATLRYGKALLAKFPADASAGNALAGAEKPKVALTQREVEILALVAQAMSNKRIALTLNITVETVKWNLRNIFAKLGVSSRYHAMVWAREQSLIA